MKTQKNIKSGSCTEGCYADHNKALGEVIKHLEGQGCNAQKSALAKAILGLPI